MTLTQFLLARIAEDEGAYRNRSTIAYIHQTGCYYYNASLEMGEVCDCDEDGAATRRGLAECEAKRRIVELHPEMLGWCQGCANETHPCRTLILLALPYADHPDYRQEWAA